LPTNAVAAFMLAAMVAHDGLKGYFMRGRPTEPNFDLMLMSIEFKSEHATLRFGWPVPDPKLLLDIMIISNRWETVMKHPEARASTMPQLAILFLELVVRTQKDRPPTS
jgi:hypothetical protein